MTGLDSIGAATSTVANDSDDEKDKDDEEDDEEAEEDKGDAATANASSRRNGHARVHSRQKKTQSASASSNGMDCLNRRRGNFEFKFRNACCNSMETKNVPSLWVQIHIRMLHSQCVRYLRCIL